MIAAARAIVSAALFCASVGAADPPAPAIDPQTQLATALADMTTRSDALSAELTRLTATIVADATVLSGDVGAVTADSAHPEPGLYVRALDAQSELDRLPAADPARAAQEQRLAAIQKRIIEVSTDLTAAKARVHELQVEATRMRTEFGALLQRLEALSRAPNPPAPATSGAESAAPSAAEPALK